MYSGVFRFVVGERVIRFNPLLELSPILFTMSGRFFDDDDRSIDSLMAYGVTTLGLTVFDPA